MTMRHLLLAASAALALSGCTCEECETCDTEECEECEEFSTALTVDGPGYLEVHASALLEATTLNADDSGYTWASSDELVATVAEDGTVMGVSPGEVTITATGADSALEGALEIVVQIDVPYDLEWAGSGHADYEAEAFRHWDEDDPAEISASCAQCHSTYGFQDYLGEDGSAFGSVESAAALGSAIECAACHNDTAAELDTTTFPSGVVLEDLGKEALCMTCHQGRESGLSIDEAIAELGETIDEDMVYEDLGFSNIHYYAAGATLYAGVTMGAYQYEDSVYDVRFRHAPGYETCTDCHDPHTLELKLTECADCHEGVSSVDDLHDVRMPSSLGSDYDGDGDTSEGLYHEYMGVHEILYEAIQAYPDGTTVADICYNASAYPYWFTDTDGSGGECSEDEATYANAYATWTPRLLKAAYNYQTTSKDPGAYAHNAKYMIQASYDSIMDMGGDVSAMDRDDMGHFNGAGEAARHWDEDYEVSTSCSACHAGSEGFHFYVEYGVGKTVEETANALDCATCHPDMPNWETTTEVGGVMFPGGEEIAFEDNNTNMCGTCHAGRVGKADIDDKIADGEGPYSFSNVHYLPAAAILAGADAKVGYEYEGMSYTGMWDDHPAGNECTDCHDAAATEHTFDVEHDYAAQCATCHSGTTSSHDIRSSGHGEDYDGDGSSSESLAGEIEGLGEDLYAALQLYAEVEMSAPICYDSSAYPYWFNDTDGNGECAEGTEANYGNQYTSFDAAMLKAAHNFQIYQKEHGAWAHNFEYMGQLLYDSIDDLIGAEGYVRP